MINRKVNFTPIFRYPSIKGVITGVLSLAIYLSLMFGLRFMSKLKTKNETKEFIINNIIVFILGLILFWSVGAGFFVDTPNYG